MKPYSPQRSAEICPGRDVSVPSDVFTILQEIQRTWSYLEPLFIGSEEVKKELPEDAKRFEGIDTDVKALLKSVSRQC